MSICKINGKVTINHNTFRPFDSELSGIGRTPKELWFSPERTFYRELPGPIQWKYVRNFVRCLYVEQGHTSEGLLVINRKDDKTLLFEG